jgi:hypothetical protein
MFPDLQLEPFSTRKQEKRPIWLDRDINFLCGRLREGVRYTCQVPARTYAMFEVIPLLLSTVFSAIFSA